MPLDEVLTITVPDREYYDQEKEEFITFKGQTLQMKHSLLSLAKWEARWNKSFLSSVEKSNEEILDYIRCMTITQNVDPTVYSRLTQKNMEEINDHINAKMTATTFTKTDNRKSKEVITAEIIYYWMISYNIPIEFQKWHLNRLLTLIEVFSRKNAPPKKMSKGEIMRRNHALNMQRRKALGSKG